MDATAPTVVVLQKSLPQYRAPFFSLLREQLRAKGVGLRLIYGDAPRDQASRRDSVDLGWAEFRRNRFVEVCGRTGIWQPALDVARQADLLIVEQATRLLVNYPLLLSQPVRGTRVAFWGHGANLQPHGASARAEEVKRAVSRFPHWWFAYTAGVGRLVEAWGYPADRITVVQNSIDTRGLQRLRADVEAGAEERVRADLDLGGGPVVAALGRLCAEKRVDFLLAACDRVFQAVPDFRLLLIGDGPMRADVERLVAVRSYARVLGAVFGIEKVRVLTPASLLLNPGAVGLVIVDAFALDLPLVTTSIDYHGPEIEYLEPGANGVVVDPPDNSDRYADTIIKLLQDPARITQLRQGCRRSAVKYTVEAMADRFAGGVLDALIASPRWRLRGASGPRGRKGARRS